MSNQKLKFSKSSQGVEFDFDVELNKLEGHLSQGAKENVNPNISNIKYANQVANKESKVKFKEDLASLKSSQKRADGDESYESFQSLVKEEQAQEKLHNQNGKSSDLEAPHDEDDAAIEEFMQAATQTKEAHERARRAQFILSEYLSQLIDQEFKGPHMDEVWDMPIEEFLNNREKYDKTLRFVPIENDQAAELNAEADRLLHFDPPEVVREEHSVQCSIPMSPGPKFREQQAQLQNDLVAAESQTQMFKSGLQEAKMNLELTWANLKTTKQDLAHKNDELVQISADHERLQQKLQDKIESKEKFKRTQAQAEKQRVQNLEKEKAEDAEKDRKIIMDLKERLAQQEQDKATLVEKVSQMEQDRIDQQNQIEAMEQAKAEEEQQRLQAIQIQPEEQKLGAEEQAAVVVVDHAEEEIQEVKSNDTGVSGKKGKTGRKPRKSRSVAKPKATKKGRAKKGTGTKEEEKYQEIRELDDEPQKDRKSKSVDDDEENEAVLKSILKKSNELEAEPSPSPEQKKKPGRKGKKTKAVTILSDKEVHMVEMEPVAAVVEATAPAKKQKKRNKSATKSAKQEQRARSSLTEDVEMEDQIVQEQIYQSLVEDQEKNKRLASRSQRANRKIQRRNAR